MNTVAHLVPGPSTKPAADDPPVLEWLSAEAISLDPAVANRNLFARKFAREESLDAILALWAGMSVAEAAHEFGAVFDALGIDSLAGRGIEIGAGLAPLAACAAGRFRKVESILAVELVPEVVRLLQRRVLRAIAGEAHARVQGVIGSFDEMHVADGAMDFCLEFDALHHSNDLVKTLTEVARVLRPGGILVCVDRAHPDSLTEEQRQTMLNVEYPLAWKRTQGYPDAPLTRRQNGEHEIRFAEWYRAFDAAGFELDRRLEFRPVDFGRFVRKCLLAIPFGVRNRLSLQPSRVSPQTGELGWMLGTLIGTDAPHPLFKRGANEHTLFLARRR
jgi:SAM-dependent methyltransferase